MRGEKILQFCLETTKFRDSMSHFPTSLDSLPKMLGFSGDWKREKGREKDRIELLGIQGING